MGMLFMPQGDDGIEAGSLHGGPHSKEQANAYGSHKAHDDCPEGDGGGQSRHQRADQ